MPDILPFKAHRYSRRVRLKDALCPPYDVISAPQAEKLRRDPANAIHIELPLGGDEKKYRNARRAWVLWKKRKLVLQDPEPAFYVYEQVFRVGRRTYRRKGFFCEARVEEPGKGSILRHELTLSGPKQDRLNLLRTLEVNSSPIFGLFNDSRKAVRNALNRASRARPAVQVQDAEAVTHRLWILKDPKAIASIREGIGKQPVLIADGHHRYETAWNYHAEMEMVAGPERRRSEATLFFVCPMQDPGLVIFPTHRVLVQKAPLADLVARLGQLKDFLKFTRCSRPPQDLLRGLRPPDFIATDGSESIRVRPASLAKSRESFPGKPESYINLSLVHLHFMLFPELNKEDFIYTHDEEEALALARARETTAILVPATTAQELYSVVSCGELMPQKSTYFYPKLITGLVFRSLTE